MVRSRAYAYVLASLMLAGVAAPVQGQQLLAEAPPFDVRHGAAHLETLFDLGVEDHFDDAARLYLGLLGSLDRNPAGQERAILNRHMAQLTLILPEAVRRQVIDGDGEASPESWSFKPDAGARLFAWWRSQDPLPATRNNERLEEHLQRVAYAEATYPHTDRITGLDERGEVYVRYGPPRDKLSVSFMDGELGDLVFRPGAVVNLTDFPDNEFWGYWHIDRAAYFIFVKKRGEYRSTEANDLLPDPLRFGFGNTGRGRQKVDMMLAILREAYRQLAPLHPDFMARYSDVLDYSRGLEDGSLSGQTQAPSVFAESFLVKSSAEDGQAFGRRETLVPRQATDVLRETESLPLAMRTARFLDEDGTTRTEIYWSPHPGGLLSADRRRDLREGQNEGQLDQYIVKLTVVQKADAYEERVVNVRHYHITDVPATDEAVIPVQSMVVKGDTGRYHLALQWDQHLSAGEGRAARNLQRLRLGPRLKVATQRADSLTALVADEAVLEMSDLRLEIVPEAARQAGRFETALYPYETVPVDRDLGLYFEVYHLAFGADDQTHYEVAYTLERGDGGSLLTFLGGRPDAQTTVETRYTGSDRTARESMLLDLSEWGGDGALNVTVRVTDTTTGRQVERTLQFAMRQ